MRLTRLVLLLAVLIPGVAFAEGEGMPRNAFLMEMRLGGAAPVSVTGLTGVPSFFAVPTLLAGARLVNRFQVGLGFSFFRVSNAGGTDFNAVTFAPTFAVDLVKSQDDRVALYLKAALPLGPLITCTNGAPCDNSAQIGFDFAVGARYALHRMFAMGLEAGVEGNYFNPQRNDTTGIVSFYGALVGSFYAGH